MLFFGVILPHTKVFGGVKRFFEIGNILIERGHSFKVFTPEGLRPTWFDFKGEVLQLSNLYTFSFDALFVTEPTYLENLQKASTKLRIFYAVLERASIRKALQKKDIIVFANSGKLYRFLNKGNCSNVVKAFGGIDLEKFSYKPSKSNINETFTVLVYGRFYRKKKGTRLVIKACEALYRKGYNIRLLLFDSPVDDRARDQVRNFKCKLPFEFFVDYPVKDLQDLYYKANVFVSAERNAGWSNTSAEAMACGVPVIATRSGTEDFLIHNKTGLVVWRHSFFIQRAIKKLIENPHLALKFTEAGFHKIKNFSWQNLSSQIQESVLKLLLEFPKQ